MAVPTIVKSAAYASGALPAWHRWRNADTLTVAMFHRVLEPTDKRWRDADPTYTVSSSLFRDCLVFFARHYKLVGLNDVIAARRGGAPLPARALLITFDDGWADNVEVALDLLRQADAPATVFVAADPVASEANYWWQEDIVRGHRHGTLAAAPALPVAPLFDVIDAAARLDPASRDAAVAPLAAGRHSTRRDMMTPEQLRRMADAGIAIGSHGAAHLPLAARLDAADDLIRSRRVLETLLAGTPGAAIQSMSFPHGRYDDASVDAARTAGFALLFTSDYVLNPLVDGRPTSDILGRISIQADQISGPDGRLQPERLALWLFGRQRTMAAA